MAMLVYWSVKVGNVAFEACNQGTGRKKHKNGKGATQTVDKTSFGTKIPIPKIHVEVVTHYASMGRTVYIYLQ